MADLAHLRISVDSRDARGAANDLNWLSRSALQAQGASTGLSRAANSLTTVLKSLGFGYIAMEAIKMADAVTSMTSKIRLVTASQEELVAVQERLFSISTGTRTSLEGTTELYARMARSAKGLGASQNDLLRVTEAINKATVVSGATASEAQAGIIQLAQGFASGTLRGDELNSVLEQMPRVATMIADGMGITVGQLRKFGAEGKLTSKDVFGSILKMAGTVDEEFAQMPMTVGQSLTNLRSHVLKFVGQINQATGFTQGLANVISRLAENLSALAAVAGVVAARFVAIRASMTAEIVANYLKQVIGLERALGATSVRQALFSASLKGAQRAFAQLTATMMVNPFVLIATAISAVIALLYAYRDEQFKVGDETVTIGNVMLGVWDYVKRGIEFVQRVFREGWGAALSSISPALAAVGRVFDAVMKGIFTVVRNTVNKIVGFFVGLGAAIVAVFKGESAKEAFLSQLNIDYIGAATSALGNLVIHLNDVGAASREATASTVDLNRALGVSAPLTAEASDADKKRAEKLQNATEAMRDYIQSLRDQREEIGLNEIQLEKLNQVRERARIVELEALGLSREKANAMRAELDEAGAGLITRMQQNMVEQLELSNAALREQVALFWASAEAQDAAAARREGQSMGLEGDFLQQFIDKSVETGRLERARDELEQVKEKLEEIRDLTFDIDLEGVFGNWGKALGGLLNTFEEFQSRQEDIAKLLRRTDISETERRMLQDKSLRNQINLYGNLAASAKGFFKEKSAGYKAMQAAETAFRAVEFALSVRATAQKVAEGAAQMFASLGPLGFAAVAGMLAVMAGLGFSGGGSSSRKPTYNTGTGTVLGDDEAQSESIANSLSRLNDINDQTMRYSAQMTVSLRNIESSMAGVASVLVRSAGFKDLGAGVDVGFEPNLIGKVLGSRLGGAALGTGVAAGLISSFGTFTALGAAGGPIGLALGAIIGGIFAPVLKSLFGTKTKIVGQGIYGGAQSIEEILSGGFSAQYFTDIQKKKKFFGFTTSTKYETKFSAADSEINRQLSMIFTNLNSSLLLAAGALGISTESIASKLNSFVVNLGKIDTKGKTGEEIQEALGAAIGAAADQMALAAFPELQKFQKVGEGFFETVIRVATTVEQFETVMRGLGNTTKVTMDNIMALEEMFGGISELSSSVSAYFDGFFSDSEKLAVHMQQLTAVFGDLGMALPQTIEGYKALVDGLDLNTEAGQQAFYALMQLAPVYLEVLNLQDRVAKTQLDLANDVKAAYRTQRDELQNTIKQFQEFSDRLRTFRDTLYSAGTTATGYRQALVDLIRVGSLAATGDAASLDQLQGVSQVFLTASKTQARSLFEYQKDVALVASYVDQGIAAADEQVSSAQQQIDLLDAAVGQLIDLNEKAQTLEEAITALLLSGYVPPAGMSDGATSQGAMTAEQFANMEALLADALYNIAKNTGNTARLLDRWDGDGQPDIREYAGDYY